MPRARVCVFVGGNSSRHPTDRRTHRRAEAEEDEEDEEAVDAAAVTPGSVPSAAAADEEEEEGDGASVGRKGPSGPRRSKGISSVRTRSQRRM